MGLGLASFYYYFFKLYLVYTGRLVAYGSEYLCIIAAVYPGGLELRRSVIAHEMNELKRPLLLDLVLL